MAIISSLYDQEQQEEENKLVKDILKLSLLEDQKNKGEFTTAKQRTVFKTPNNTNLNDYPLDTKVPDRIELQGLRVKKDLPSLNLPEFKLNLGTKGMPISKFIQIKFLRIVFLITDQINQYFRIQKDTPSAESRNRFSKRMHSNNLDAIFVNLLNLNSKCIQQELI